MFPTYSFRQFVRTRRTGTPDNVATPEREFHNVRQRVPPGQCPDAVDFGLYWSAIPFSARQEYRPAMSARVNLGLYRQVNCGQHRRYSSPQIGTRLEAGAAMTICEAGQRTHFGDLLNRE
jgi:hypothetical protein